ncbi:Ser-Thr-rich glycosyl-phosphatidyl-inositol-anchored membrane family-domain-containing protein [Hypoxylon rubiginosum]|uniref:Ser-Thr-rich glycosyl-phosphatidyl-inositol-anchored membrane family-domain-containing protein n=1 Tax=Hypoxylon rubiginosum TaxID=110542 RepID=A0ACB9ZCI0_9PEZI|nr:Ser-Thr-rich glycosyl-phosphatidyl-inositol-anchored membrane family-domain-containing protein [Hypoxylon rubiginosum]
MKSVILAVLLAALPAWVSAVLITNSNFDGVEAGKPFDITWSDATGPVTLTLKDGPSENLQTVGEITSGQTGESYTWTPSPSLPSGTYALEISDGTEVNYSKQFDIAGGSASSSSSVSSTASSTSSSSTVSSTTASSTTSSASATTSSTDSSSSGSSTSSSSRVSSTSSASRTSSASTSATAPPNTNAAQTAAPFVAPLLLALGAAFI